MVAFGRRCYRAGMISRRLMARALWSQLVFHHLGADEERMRKFRESALRITTGWDQARISTIVRRHAHRGDRADRLRRGARPHPRAPGRRAHGVHRLGVTRGDRRAARPATSASTRRSPAGPGSTTTAATPARSSFYSYGPYKAEAILEVAELGRHRPRPRPTPTRTRPPTCPMLEVVGHPVAVNPDRELARIARDREWEVRQFRIGGAAARAGADAAAAAGRRRGGRRPRSPPSVRARLVVVEKNNAPAAQRWLRRAKAPGCLGVLQLLHREGGQREDDDEDEELLHASELTTPAGVRAPVRRSDGEEVAGAGVAATGDAASTWPGPRSGGCAHG